MTKFAGHEAVNPTRQELLLGALGLADRLQIDDQEPYAACLVLFSAAPQPFGQAQQVEPEPRPCARRRIPESLCILERVASNSVHASASDPATMLRLDRDMQLTRVQFPGQFFPAPNNMCCKSPPLARHPIPSYWLPSRLRP